MKKLMIAAGVASMSFALFAADAKKSENVKPVETEQAPAPIFWGFANYGLYSGYQLYGSLLNNEPTLQGYAELNANLSIDDLDLGYFGAGIWSNTDLTRRRSGSSANCGVNSDGIGDAFNEWDFNLHWGRTFWFDDERTWGLGYRASVVWYYYPGKYYSRIQPGTDTTFDFNHYFELVNPYLIPYLNVVHEYRFDANLLQFGLKKPFQVTDQFSLCPFIEFVARPESHYNWCMPTRIGTVDTCAGMATLKVELDATYMFTKNFGMFAKVAYCSIIDHHMRNTCDDILASDEYGENKDFAWGGVGICVNF